MAVCDAGLVFILLVGKSEKCFAFYHIYQKTSGPLSCPLATPTFRAAFSYLSLKASALSITRSKPYTDRSVFC